MKTKKSLTVIESVIITISIVLLNLLVKPEDPGFSELYYTPYIIASLFSAVYFGRPFGFASLLAAAVSITVFNLLNSTSYFAGFSKTDALSAAAALFLVYIFGTIVEIERSKIKNLSLHHRQAVRAHYRMKKLTEAQLEINRELEERVSGQRTTITTLYNQMHRMDSLNLGKSLEVLLETVKLFTNATAVSIWTQSHTPGFLYSPASMHRDGCFDPSELLNIEDSIEGWTFRNNRIVSARMLHNYENLRRMDRGRNLLTIPIPLNNKVWGVLNIEEMPFVKYNQYTERLLEIIISLAEPSLSRAVEHERYIQQSEIDKDTGLPLFSQLFTTLERLVRNSSESSASLLILEIRNFSEIAEENPPAQIKKLFLRLTDEILLSSAGLAEFFMYKEENQMAVLIPGLAGDGASLLCLEVLEFVNSATWLIGNNDICLEMIIGYSSLGDNADSAEGLTTHAEHLLEIQKI